MTVLRLILADQLNHQIASLRNINIDTYFVLMAEVGAEFTDIKHHKRKIAFLFASIRHFARELRQSGITAIYLCTDVQNNGGSLESGSNWVIASRKISTMVVTMPGEYRLMEMIRS